MENGQTTVITGDGKGKTTAGFGMAIRAAGWNNKVLIIQFLKKGNYGEIRACKEIKNITVQQYGSKNLINLKKSSQNDKARAKKGLKATQKAIKSKKYDLIILDEINLAIKYKLISKKEVLEMIDQKPINLDLVLTGRKADKKLINKANLASKVISLKHPYDKGRKARKGFEY